MGGGDGGGDGDGDGKGGERKLPRFRALGVATDLVGEGDESARGDGEGKGFGSPCGMCRQVLREFCSVCCSFSRDFSRCGLWSLARVLERGRGGLVGMLGWSGIG